MSCPICCEKFTDFLRKPVKCLYCNYTTCTKCIKQYLLTITDDPNCMNCHILWNKELIDDNLSKNFRTKDLKNHRENVLLEREKSLLPATMPAVEREQIKRDNRKLLHELYEKRYSLKNELNNLDKSIGDLIYAINNNVNIGESSKSAERKTFIKACVVTGCRGFLSTQWKCGVCSTWVCSNCHEIKNSKDDDTHVCNKDNIESAKLVMKETKPCPNCASLIFKINGCDQMWCTMCHTTFSWKTGNKIISNTLHNPHYFEWLRKNNNGNIPRAPGDIPLACGGLPPYWEFSSFINKNTKKDPRINNLMNLFREILHIQDIELRPINDNNNMLDNEDLRIKFILNELDEDRWKQELHKREKRREFKIAKRQVYEMLVTVGNDLINNIYAQSTSKDTNDLKIMLNQCEELVKYYNDSLSKVYERFNSKSKSMYFTDKWKIVY